MVNASITEAENYSICVFLNGEVGRSISYSIMTLDLNIPNYMDIGMLI